MSPKRIIREAIKKNLDIIAICDHNSAENVKYVKRAAKNFGITVLPGMEITSREEVHILGIFGTLKDVLNVQKVVYQYLTPGKNNPEYFGDQVVVNEFDEVEGFNERLLVGATDLTVKKITEIIHKYSGLSIASHIDRESFSIIGQLGFIPDNVGLDAVEITSRENIEKLKGFFPKEKNFPVVTSSDAHYINDIGKKYIDFLIEKPSITEIGYAFKNIEGRRIL